MTTQAQSVIATATSQRGYHEGRDTNGNWNNQNKFAAELGMPNGVSWCCEFTFWVFAKAGLENLLPTKRTAWVPTLAQAFKDAGRWSTYPAIGAVPFFGGDGQIANLHHVGAVVTAFTATTVTHIDGNTNNTGAAQGDGVYELTHQRADAYVVGYGYPNYMGGIESADPAWVHQNPSNQHAAPVTNIVTGVDSALGFAANKWTAGDCDRFLASVKAAGHGIVFVYLSRYPAKNMPRWAILRCLAAGLAISFVWEDDGTAPSKGATQGHADAAEAIRQLRALGAPTGIVVFVAYDQSGYTLAAGTADRAYGEAFASDITAAGFVTGGYGNRAVCDSGIVTVKWLVETWTRIGTAGVHIIQLVNNPIRPVPGCDTNRIVHGFRCWTVTATPPAYGPYVSQAIATLVTASQHTTANSAPWSKIRAAVATLRSI